MAPNPTGDDSRSASEKLKDLRIGSFVTLKKIEQGGALQARRLSTGTVQFYWRYTHSGRSDRVPIGTHDPAAPPRSLSPSNRGFSLAAAVEACRSKALIQLQQQPVGGYREHVAALKRKHDEAKAKQREAAEQTLEKLLDAYCDHLQAMGRRSHSDARSIFKLHIKEAWPKLAATPAAQVTAKQVAVALRDLIERKEKGRTANKLRAYLRAAYQCALDVDSLLLIPARFEDFQVTANPVALTKRSAQYDRADKRPLTIEELRAYWKLLAGATGVAGTALRLHLLTGGQRVEQFVKLKRSDVTDTTITLYDGKGRPGRDARVHLLPLTKRAQEEVKRLSTTGEFALSTDGGETHISAATLSGWACELAQDIEGFQLKRVRSGVETALAAAGTSKEVRGHLQSHGLSGVQSRHYEAYDYAKEKLAALATLDGLLQPTSPATRQRERKPK